MKNLNIKAFGGLLWLIAVLAISIFTSAGTVHYWQGWAFLCTFSVCVFVITIYLMKKDPKLLKRRVNAGPSAEKESFQKIIQGFATITFLIVIIFPAIDHRYGWSVVPSYVCIVGDIIVAAGLLIVFLVFKENTFTSATIEVDTEQKVISTGPYAIVRHPMYIGAIIMLLGIPLALGSWWGLLTVVPITVVIILRLLDEEIFLVKNLGGYVEYRSKVKYRLVLFIW